MSSRLSVFLCATVAGGLILCLVEASFFSMAYEVKDFDEQVIERSREVPVVVDFWAEWCGPCLMFAPVIEKAASEAKGAWELVKVNTEEHPDLSARFQIRSLPTVRIFKDGEVVSEQLGAMPEPAFLEWIGEFVDSPGKESARKTEELLFQGRLEEASAILEAEEAEMDPHAALRFRAILSLAQAPEAVSELAKKIPLSASEHNDGGYLAELASLRVKGGEGAFGEGLDALARLDFSDAAGKWIEALTLDDAHSGARKALKNLFLLLGPSHPATREFQPQFSRLVFS